MLYLLRVLLVFTFAISLLVRLTLRDHISGLSTLYDATPLPVLAAIAFLIGLSGSSERVTSDLFLFCSLQRDAGHKRAGFAAIGNN